MCSTRARGPTYSRSMPSFGRGRVCVRARPGREVEDEWEVGWKCDLMLSSTRAIRPVATMTLKDNVRIYAIQGYTTRRRELTPQHQSQPPARSYPQSTANTASPTHHSSPPRVPGFDSSAQARCAQLHGRYRLDTDGS